MKRCAALLLFFYAGVSLFAQAYHDATIYLPAVTGTGNRSGDNEYITNRIIEHLEKLGYLPVRYPRATAFSLFASIARQNSRNRATGDGPLPLNQPRTYVLNLKFVDNKTGETVIGEDLFYYEAEEIGDLLITKFKLGPYVSAIEPEPEPIPIEEIPVVAEEPKKDPDEWRTKSWYLSAGVFWAPRIYKGSYESSHYVNFGYGIGAEYHFLKIAPGIQFLKYLSVGAGLELVPDWIAVRIQDETYHYRDLLLEIPVLVNAVFRPSDYFMLIPYGGAQFTIPLYGETKPFLLAWRAGFQYGIKTGPGVLVLDPWFSMDLGPSRITSNTAIKYRRYMINIGVKYKYGFDNFKNFFWFIK